jgi:hypothetical protein
VTDSAVRSRSLRAALSLDGDRIAAGHTAPAGFPANSHAIASRPRRSRTARCPAPASTARARGERRLRLRNRNLTHRAALRSHGEVMSGFREDGLVRVAADRRKLLVLRSRERERPPPFGRGGVIDVWPTPTRRARVLARGGRTFSLLVSISDSFHAHRGGAATVEQFGPWSPPQQSAYGCARLSRAANTRAWMSRVSTCPSTPSSELLPLKTSSKPSLGASACSTFSTRVRRRLLLRKSTPSLVARSTRHAPLPTKECVTAPSFSLQCPA